MSKKTTKARSYKIISLRKLAEASGVDYMAIYWTLNGRYNGLSVHERTQLSNTAYVELKDFFEMMGFDIKLVRLPDHELSARGVS